MTLPAFFAIADATARRVWLFDAHPELAGRRRNIYRVRPSSRFAHWSDEHPGFLLQDGDAERSAWHDRSTFIIDSLPVTYYGGGSRPTTEEWDCPVNWFFTGRTVYSMLCPDPIPILEVSRPDIMPMIPINLLRTVAGSRILFRVWQRRWDPETVAQEIQQLEQPPAPQTRSPPPPHPQPQPPKQTVPPFVAAALIRDAISNAATCPITMEPIAADTAAVTDCFHVFDANAIAIWLADNHTCPTCKQKTALPA